MKFVFCANPLLLSLTFQHSEADNTPDRCTILEKEKEKEEHCQRTQHKACCFDGQAALSYTTLTGQASLILTDLHSKSQQRLTCSKASNEPIPPDVPSAPLACHPKLREQYSSSSTTPLSANTPANPSSNRQPSLPSSLQPFLNNTTPKPPSDHHVSATGALSISAIFHQDQSSATTATSLAILPFGADARL